MAGLSHVSVGVNDVSRAKAFYDPLMQLLGPKVRQADEESVDYGTDDGLVFVSRRPRIASTRRPAMAYTLLSKQPDQDTVNHFHREALRLGRSRRRSARPASRNTAPRTTVPSSWILTATKSRRLAGL